MTISPTPRLYFRELREADAPGMFELDANPAVHRYLGSQPLTEVSQSLAMIQDIQAQYRQFGIGRWGVFLRATDEFIGWAGLKFIAGPLNGRTNVYDLGYRFIERFWGQGYGYEAAQAWLNHGFEQMKLPLISAYVDEQNQASRRIMEKLGMQLGNSFEDEGDICVWYERSNPQL
ncbi:GNAT family N-acetyltransferase [Hymenobacter saemangeumensis]|uniref:GNAT family N-acetyltransferase n=1 Tax=Hymenobacter saemangeumensis TaxID=1084522 RepID=A0ABP8HY28_9BACT